MTRGLVIAGCIVGYCAVVVIATRMFHKARMRTVSYVDRADLSDESLARVLAEWSR